MPQSIFARTTLAAVCAAAFAAGAATAGPVAPAPAGDVTFKPLPAETRARFNSPPPEQPVDAQPEIDALQDRRAEWRFQEQVDRSKAREAMKRRLQGVDSAELEVLDPEAARRETMRLGRSAADDPTPLHEDAPLLTEDDLQTDRTQGLDGPVLSQDAAGGSVLQ